MIRVVVVHLGRSPIFWFIMVSLGGWLLIYQLSSISKPAFVLTDEEAAAATTEHGVTATPEMTAAATPTPVTLTTTPAPTPAALNEPIRAVGISYEHVAQSRAEVPVLQERIAAAGINMVGITAGRPDWAYFKWADYPEYWASQVEGTGIDFLAEDTAAFAVGHVNAIVDIYAPNYIKANPDAAAISFWGEPSPLLVSTAALTTGPFHDLVLDMLAYIAANYAVDSISLTELSYRIYGYGVDDLTLYQAYTGQTDWPRDHHGDIVVDHPSIGAWRSVALAGFLAEAAAVVRPHGVELFFDVSVSWGNLSNEGQEYGHHYPALLEVVDRLIIWGYTDLAGYPPTYLAEIATYLAQHYRPEQIIVSIGLWGPDGTTMSPEDLAAAITTLQTTAIPHIWITPTLLMADEHWLALINPSP